MVYNCGMKKKLKVLFSLLIIALFVFWFFYPLRSIAVMSVYSASHAKESVMKQSGFEIDMPSGKGWYPFVMTYNAGGFKRYSGLEADMSIMYSFGSFDILKRTSTIYDKQSDKYSSFYGAYVVKQKDGIFAFDDNGNFDVDELSLAVKYDYTKLVIQDFGCDEPVFALDRYEAADGMSFAGTSSWIRVDAVLTVNGAAHNYNGYKTPYLQYGRPMQEYDTDFEVTNVYGRVYTKYFEEYDCTVMAYIIAPSTEALEKCDSEILSGTIIAPLS